MNPGAAEAEIFTEKDSELALSGPALAVLLKAVLAKGLPFRFKARGISMSPFIKDGDVITVFPRAERPLGLGRIAVYLHPITGQPVAHRVVAAYKQGYRIQGDGTATADGPVLKADILGTVEKIERKGQEIIFGLGPERIVISLLLRFGIISRLLTPLWKAVRPYLRGQAT